MQRNALQNIKESHGYSPNTNSAEENCIVCRMHENLILICKADFTNRISGP
jgi:hypothetical protein